MSRQFVTAHFYPMSEKPSPYNTNHHTPTPNLSLKNKENINSGSSPVKGMKQALSQSQNNQSLGNNNHPNNSKKVGNSTKSNREEVWLGLNRQLVESEVAKVVLGEQGQQQLDFMNNSGNNYNNTTSLGNIFEANPSSSPTKQHSKHFEVRHILLTNNHHDHSYHNDQQQINTNSIQSIEQQPQQETPYMQNLKPMRHVNTSFDQELEGEGCTDREGYQEKPKDQEECEECDAFHYH